MGSASCGGDRGAEKSTQKRGEGEERAVGSVGEKRRLQKQGPERPGKRVGAASKEGGEWEEARRAARGRAPQGWDGGPGAAWAGDGQRRGLRRDG